MEKGSFREEAGTREQQPRQEYAPLTEDMSYYERLGLSQGATPEEIKVAYRKLSLVYHTDKRVNHPELGNDEDSFKFLSEAYEILSNPKQRASYDATLGFSSYDDFDRDTYGTMSEAEMIRSMDDIRARLDHIHRGCGGSQNGLRNSDEGNTVNFETIFTELLNNARISARIVSMFFETYSQTIQSVTTLNKLLNDPRLNQAIVEESADKARISPTEYERYVGEWVQLYDFDRKEADHSEEVHEAILQGAKDAASISIKRLKGYIDHWKQVIPTLKTKKIVQSNEVLTLLNGHYIHLNQQSYFSDGLDDFLNDCRAIGISWLNMRKVKKLG